MVVEKFHFLKLVLNQGPSVRLANALPTELGKLGAGGIEALEIH